MPFVTNDHMIETVAPDRTDQSFGIAVLPRRPQRRRTVSYAHRFELSFEDRAIDRVIVADERIGRFGPRECFDKLLGRPFCCRMRRDADMQKFSPGIPTSSELAAAGGFMQTLA